MSDNVIRFPGFTDLERDLVDLELADPESIRRVREYQDRVGRIFGFEYLVSLLIRVSRGKPVLPDGFDPVKDPLPHQYAHQFDQLDARELELFRRWVGAILDNHGVVVPRLRKELFYLRAEAVRRSRTIESDNSESTAA